MRVCEFVEMYIHMYTYVQLRVVLDRLSALTPMFSYVCVWVCVCWRMELLLLSNKTYPFSIWCPYSARPYDFHLRAQLVTMCSFFVIVIVE